MTGGEASAALPDGNGKEVTVSGGQAGSGGYRQIMADVRAGIGSGAIPVGAPVPSITEQAARLRCARVTVSRAPVKARTVAAELALARIEDLGGLAAAL